MTPCRLPASWSLPRRNRLRLRHLFLRLHSSRWRAAGAYLGVFSRIRYPHSILLTDLDQSTVLGEPASSTCPLIMRPCVPFYFQAYQVYTPEAPLSNGPQIDCLQRTDWEWLRPDGPSVTQVHQDNMVVMHPDTDNISPRARIFSQEDVRLMAEEENKILLARPNLQLGHAQAMSFVAKKLATFSRSEMEERKRLVHRQEQFKRKIGIVIKNPALFRMYKEHAASFRSGSPVASRVALHEFLEDLKLPEVLAELKDHPDVLTDSPTDSSRRSKMLASHRLFSSFASFTGDAASVASEDDSEATPMALLPKALHGRKSSIASVSTSSETMDSSWYDESPQSTQSRRMTYFARFKARSSKTDHSIPVLPKLDHPYCSDRILEDQIYEQMFLDDVGVVQVGDDDDDEVSLSCSISEATLESLRM